MNVVLSPETQQRLREAATQRGIHPEDLAKELIEHNLRPAETPVPNQATLDLFDEWERQDRTDDPEEIARRIREGDELIENLARNRIEMEGPNARKLWP